VKPSPISSILLFIGAPLLVWAALGTSWFTMNTEEYSFGIGLIRGENCSHGHCESMTIFSGGSLGLHGMLAIVTFLCAFGGAVLSVIAGIQLLKPGRRVLSVITMCAVAAAGLFSLIILLWASFRGIGYGVGVFWAGIAATLTGSIIAMARPRAPQMMRPMMYPPHMQRPMHPNQPQYQQPMQQQPQYQQAMQQQPLQPGAPCPTCSSPTMWVQQYGRIFCQRCNKYL
jgi:hypothetical protein